MKRGEKQIGREGGLEQLAASLADNNRSEPVVARSVASGNPAFTRDALDCFAPLVVTRTALISLDLWNLGLDISGLFEPDGAA